MVTDRQCCEYAAAIYDPSVQWDHLLPGTDDDYVYVGLKKTPGYDLISCRGSDCGMDWVHDADGIPFLYPPFGIVHSGFWKGILAAYAELKALITQPVVLVGHSLGGAHTQYLAGLFVLDGIMPAKVCCFGSPKPGYQKFAEVVAPIANYTLYKNGPDFVTDFAITLPLFPWMHVRPLTNVLELPVTNELSLFAMHHIFLYQKAMLNAPQ